MGDVVPKYLSEWQFKPPLPYVTQAPVPPPVVAALDYLRVAERDHQDDDERRAYHAALALLALYFAESAEHVRGWVNPFPVVRDLIPKADDT